MRNRLYGGRKGEGGERSFHNAVASHRGGLLNGGGADRTDKFGKERMFREHPPCEVKYLVCNFKSHCLGMCSVPPDILHETV